MSSSSLRPVSTDTGPFLIKTLKFSSVVTFGLVASLPILFVLSSRSLCRKHLMGWAIAVHYWGQKTLQSCFCSVRPLSPRLAIMVQEGFTTVDLGATANDDVQLFSFCLLSPRPSKQLLLQQTAAAAAAYCTQMVFHCTQEQSNEMGSEMSRGNPFPLMLPVCQFQQF